jgi:hypothetical protein
MRFVPADLTELAEAGVLMVVNEMVLWPLGLALAWDRAEDGSCSNLHVRQWEYEDGHREVVESAEDDVSRQRREAFAAWADIRRSRLLPEERVGLDAIAATFTATR